jgi:mono/diheme cytochrome c family protein
MLSGCEDAYTADLKYPVRTDYIVDKPFTVQPTNFNGPGFLPLTSLNPEKHFTYPDRELLKEEQKRKNILDPLLLGDKVRADIASLLPRYFGRPRAPKVEMPALETALQLDRETLAHGSVLYRQHCLHCHGVSGDGRGPNAVWLNPPPRDYRQGVFKFTSSGQAPGDRKPLRADLRRVLMNGVEGTSMPSFSLLKPDEIDAIVSYVIHLAIRGEVEFLLMKSLLQNPLKIDEPVADAKGAPQTKDVESVVGRLREDELLETLTRRWLDAQSSEIRPIVEPKFDSLDDKLASAARGYKVFANKDQANCAACHANLGRDSAYYYDSWGTVVRPRNLTANNFRGGRRPIDIYWRIHSGINGGPMPALVADVASHSAEKEKWLWDLVNFVQLVPYPEMRKLLKEKHKIDLDPREP